MCQETRGLHSPGHRPRQEADILTSRIHRYRERVATVAWLRPEHRTQNRNLVPILQHRVEGGHDGVLVERLTRHLHLGATRQPYKLIGAEGRPGLLPGRGVCAARSPRCLNRPIETAFSPDCLGWLKCRDGFLG
jgi:hypothetical protein